MKRLARQLCSVGIGATALVSLAAAHAANPRLKEIVVVFKTHFDIGFTDLATNVLTRYRTTFVDKAMKLIDDSQSLPLDRQFVWTMPGWPLEQMLWPGQTPERRAEILRALKGGRLALHALPFNTETESLDLEDLVRGMEFSTRLSRDNGLPLPRAAKMTDVPEHTWIMPTLLKHAGVNFFQIGCNGGSAVMHVPPLFWWEGPDGSRVLTSYSQRYGTQLLPPDDWPYRTWLALIVAGDNHGPPSAVEVDKLLKQAAEELPGAKIKFGRLEDFYDAILPEGDKIPVVRGDMPDTWIHGFEALPIETKLAWDVRPLESAVGVLDTELRGVGLNPPALGASLDKAYENSLLYSEHTFGFDSKKVGYRYGSEWEAARAAGQYAKFERSFDDKRDYIRSTAEIVTNAFNDRMKLLAQNVNQSGERFVVFNPLPWKRSGEVGVKTPEGDYNFSVRDVPACGYRTILINPTAETGLSAIVLAATNSEYVSASTLSRAETQTIVDTARQNGGATFESKFFKLKLDVTHGCIASLTDLQSGRELVAQQGNEGMGQYLHERFAATNVDAFDRVYCRNFREGTWMTKDFGKPSMPGTDQLPYARMTLTNWTVSTGKDLSAQTIILRCDNAAPLAKAVSVRYRLYHFQPYIDIEWSVDSKTPNPIPEGGWICLPLAIQKPSFRLGRLGSIIDPAEDILDGGNRRLLCLNSGMTVTGPDGFGVGICPMDSPLVSLDEPGLWQFSRDFVPSHARVYVNLYNNQWDTNFPLWQEGSWISRVRLWVVRRGHDDGQNLITPSWEARAPLEAAYADGKGGNLPPTGSGLEVSRPGVLVTSFGADPYSDKLLLRLWEAAGKSGTLTVKLPAGLKARMANPVDLRGEPDGKPVKISNGSFQVNLPAFAPASFVLDAGPTTAARNN